jgi:membrane-bound lytic murein transglycosylase D
MRCFAALLIALFGFGSLASAEAEPLSRPVGLEPAVAFWTRVYSEHDTNSGVIHDSEHLDIVYEKIRFAPGSSARTQERQVERTKKRYRDILKALGSGKRAELSRDEARVLGLFPTNVTNTTLRRAAGNVRFQLGQSDKFRAGIVRSGAWLPYIRRVLSETGVPLELAALPHVESSFRSDAYSRVGAAGLWQFTRSTGRRFMQVDYTVDERLDPEIATESAARLLLENYQTTGTWPLAITSYNHGAAGMRRAVRQVGTTDIARIVRSYKSRTFGFASRNFYASFLAALDVERDAKRHFGALVLEEPVEADSVRLDHYYSVSSLTRATGLGIDVLSEYNRGLRPAVWRGEGLAPKGYRLRIPADGADAPLAAMIASVPAGERHARQRGDDFYRVRRGDTLSRIAKRLGVRESDLVSANNLRSRHRIRAGMTLRVPRRGAHSVARAEPPPDGVYRVRRGDNLDTIARRFGTTPAELVQLNDLRNANRIHVGQTLRLVAAAEPPASAKPVTPPPTATDSGATPILVASAAPAGSDEARYTVKRGDTLDDIARRAGVPVRDLARANGIRNANRIAVGQTLALPETGEGAKPEEAAEPAPEPAAEQTPEPPARQADSAVVARLDAPEATAETTTTTVTVATAQPASETEAEAPVEETPEPPTDEAPPAVAAELAERETLAEASDDSESIRPPAPDPDRYAVGSNLRIRVEPGETIGHYADWLDVRASDLRRLNGIRFQTPITVGQSFRLDLRRVSAEEFERKRLDYHTKLERGFFDSFRVPAVDDYVLQRGDTLWKVARRERELPVWLLHRYNPDVDFGALRPGDRIAIPRIEPRQS